MDKTYLNILQTRYLKSLEKSKPEIQTIQPIQPVQQTGPTEDEKSKQILELKEKLDKLIKLKEEHTLDKNKKMEITMNKRTNGDPSARAQKMREAKSKKQKDEMDKLVSEIEGKDPEEVKKIINDDRRKITLLKKIISN